MCDTVSLVRDEDSVLGWEFYLLVLLFPGTNITFCPLEVVEVADVCVFNGGPEMAAEPFVPYITTESRSRNLAFPEPWLVMVRLCVPDPKFVAKN